MRNLDLCFSSDQELCFIHVACILDTNGSIIQSISVHRNLDLLLLYYIYLFKCEYEWAVKDIEFLVHIHHTYSLFIFNRRMRFDVSPARRYDINIASDTLKPSLLSLRHSCYKWAGGPCLRAAARGCTRSTAPRSRRTGRPTSPSS